MLYMNEKYSAAVIMEIDLNECRNQKYRATKKCRIRKRYTYWSQEPFYSNQSNPISSLILLNKH